MTTSTFLFHTALEQLIPGTVWHDDHTVHHTKAWLQAEGHMASLEFVWPVHDTGWSLDCLADDCLADDCLPMVGRVLDTFNRHVAGGRVGSVSCYMAPRKPATALTDPGWLEWGCGYPRPRRRAAALRCAYPAPDWCRRGTAHVKPAHQ